MFVCPESFFAWLASVSPSLWAGVGAGVTALVLVMAPVCVMYQRKQAWLITTPEKSDPLRPLLIEVTAPVHPEVL
jgi:hypothetical protein